MDIFNSSPVTADHYSPRSRKCGAQISAETSSCQHHADSLATLTLFKHFLMNICVIFV